MIIAHISDSHITHKIGDDDNLEGSSLRLQQAVTHLLRLPARPDVVLITGDCVNGGHVAEYERFQALLRPLPMPVYIIPGNHDQREHFLAMIGVQGSTPLEGFVQYVVDDWPVRLIALDTHVPEKNEGYLCEKRLAWIAARLAEAPTQPTVIFMHHPPFLTGLKGFDQIGLINADAFGAIIARHPQVERILTGHIHTIMTQRFCGTLAISCAATAYQMLPDFHHPERLAVTMQPPTCLLHVWRTETGVVTTTSLIGEHGPLVELHDGEKWIA